MSILGWAVARMLVVPVLNSLSAIREHANVCDVRVDPTNFSVLVSSSSTLDLRFLESLHILKTKPPLNNQLNSHPLSIVHSWFRYYFIFLRLGRCSRERWMSYLYVSCIGRLLYMRVFLCLVLYFLYCNIGINISLFSLNCNVKLLTCLFNFRRFVVNFLAEDAN